MFFKVVSLKFIWQFIARRFYAGIARKNLRRDIKTFQTLFFLNASLDTLRYKTFGYKKKLPFEEDIEELIEKTVEALFYFSTNQCDKISEEHTVAPSLLLTIAQSNNIGILNQVRKVYVSELPHNLLNDLKGNLNLLISECKRKDFFSVLVENALNNQLSLPSPFSKNRAFCQESYEITPDLSCLRFTDSRDSFYLLQLLSSADAIYLPYHHILIVLAHINESHVMRLQEKLLKNFATVIKYATAVNSFAGVIASHSRPSHFYYDIWPALYELMSKPLIVDNLPAVIMRKDHDFNDVGLLFGYKNHSVLASEEIDAMLVKENKWLVHIGRQQHLSDHLSYEFADRYLVKQSQLLLNEVAKSYIEQLRNCYPVVWIGVEGQKRSWLEQIEGYAYIIQRLLEVYPKLGIVFDGWTMPFTPSAASKAEVEKDRLIVQEITNRIVTPFSYVSVMGETSHTKILVGAKVDFFIANFSSGSLHISRLLGKPGFCHLSNQFSEIALGYALHIHPNHRVYLLPRRFINDKTDKNDTRHDFLSYSIDKENFYRFIEERLALVLERNPLVSLKFFIEPSYSVSYDLRRFLKMATLGNFLTIGAGEDKVIALKRYSPRYLSRFIIYGTFPFGSDEKINLRADYFIWLRQPLHRAYYHALQLSEMLTNKASVKTVLAVCTEKHKVLDNYYTRLLSGGFNVPFGQCTEQMLTMAIENLTKRFLFIGINEYPTASYDALCKMMDWDRSLFADVSPVRYQVNKNKISKAELKLIEQMNVFDLRLYSEALKAFAVQLSEQQIEMR